jgi:GNAT superfamily N-acetyltransferase
VVRILFELSGHIETLSQELQEKYGIKLRPTVRNDFRLIEVLLTDPEYPYGKDWMPQMFFVIMLRENKVLLKYLRLPKSLQKKGIGTRCFSWLIDLCRLYGIEEIQGEAAEGSETFWSQLGVVHTPQKSYYPIREKSDKSKVRS